MEYGGDDDRSNFHGNEVISAVQDEEQFYGEEEDYEDLYNDVNVGDGFYQSSIRSGEASANTHAKEEESSRDPPQSILPPIPAGDPTGKVKISGIAGYTHVGRPVDKSGAVPVSDLVGNLGLAVPVRSPALPGGFEAGLGKLSGRPGEIEGNPAGNSFGNDGYSKQGSEFGNASFHRQGLVGGGSGSANLPIHAGSTGAAAPVVVGGIGNGVASGGTTTLFVGDLHWWTTDADLEAELCKYGPVKEVKFFDEKASGKSKGYAQVEFYDPVATTACKEGMDGHVFNGKACVVAFSSVHGVRRFVEAQVARTHQAMAQVQPQSALAQKGRGSGAAHVGGNYGRGGSGGGGGNWGRGGVGNRGPMGNMRSRVGPPGGRGIMGNGGMVVPPPHMLHPGALLGQGFDPTGFGAAMGRMGGGYVGFPVGPAAGAFPGMLPSFPSVVAPHVNPAFFGRGMPTCGMGMWPDHSMGGWGAEEQSSYGDNAASVQHHSDRNYGKDRGGDRDWSGASERRQVREKDVGPGNEWSERWHNDEKDIGHTRDQDWDREGERESESDKERERERERERDGDHEKERERDRYHDDRDRHVDQYRRRDHELYHDDDWDRGRSSKARSNSREVENVKRRRPYE